MPDPVSAVVDYVFTRYPHVGRRAGRHDLDGTLPAVTPDSVSDVDALLAGVTAALDELGAGGDPEVRADLSTAMRALTIERFRIAEVGRPHRGPGEWLDETDLNVYLRSDYAPLDERLGALERHLAQLPDFLAAAATTLGTTLPAGERISGVENFRGQAAAIRGLVARLVAEYPEAGDRLGELAAAADAACHGFADAIAATKPVRAVFGPERLAAYLMATEGLDVPVAELHEEAEAEVARLTGRIDVLAARLGAGTRQEAYDLLSARVPAGSVTGALTGIIERLQEFWTGQDVVTVASTRGLEIRTARDASTSAEVSFDYGGPLETVPQPHLLHVPEPRDPALLRDYLNEPMLEVVAVHEVFPGHYLQHEVMHDSVIRRCVPWFPGATEGWAHYTEELAIERGLADGRPLVEVAAVRFALEAATRLLAFLSVHSGRSKFGAAAAGAAAVCGWSPERAAREVLAVVAEPAGAMYTLGKLRIRRWRADATDLKSFHDRIVRCGSAPLSAVRRYHLDGLAVPATK